MLFGSLGGLGCATATTVDNDAAQEPAQTSQDAVTEPEKVAETQAEHVEVNTTAAAAPEPPEPKVENPGPPPSAGLVWKEGYWRYDAPKTVYVWQSGYWFDMYARPTVAPPPLRYEYIPPPPGSYVFVPGHWSWNGRSYVWYPGHYEKRRVGHYHVSPYWVFVGGHWECRTPGWVRTRAEYVAARERRERAESRGSKLPPQVDLPEKRATVQPAVKAEAKEVPQASAKRKLFQPTSTSSTAKATATKTTTKTATTATTTATATKTESASTKTSEPAKASSTKTTESTKTTRVTETTKTKASSKPAKAKTAPPEPVKPKAPMAKKADKADAKS
jgi:hypothetical protein